MLKWVGRFTWGYAAVLAAALLVAVVAGWLPVASAIDGDAYDWMFLIQRPAPASAQPVVLGVDELALSRNGGNRRLRAILADALERIRPASPKVVAIDVILSDGGEPADDDRLEAALAAAGDVVLSSDIVPHSAEWEEPLPRFVRHAEAIGHVHADPNPVLRVIPLEKAASRTRRWAVALEAYRLAYGGGVVEESPGSIRVAGREIPGSRAEARPLYVAYSEVLTIPISELQRRPELARQMAGRVVFIGMTAQSAVRDRWMTPLGQAMSGVEIHAHAYSTIASGRFLVPASNLAVVGTCVLYVLAAGAIFAFAGDWLAYLLAGLVILTSHLVPHIAFGRGIIFAYTAPVLAAWLSVGAAAAWQHFVVRGQLRKTEADKARYQQAIHMVTHEMRSPLTAIQGSSELMSRYNLGEDKRKQIAEMINSESRRLARMIQTFLDIERLTEGHMQIRPEPFDAGALVETCMRRTEPLAARKQIELRAETGGGASLQGDRELLEYALYNLMNNAVKYSPAATIVTVSAQKDGESLRISVRDQGIGIDAQELRSIFRKFYRTRRAEASGEAGTGIGLSLVDQIVTHHGGRMEVTSTPGSGSCFTMVLPRVQHSVGVKQGN